MFFAFALHILVDLIFLGSSKAIISYSKLFKFVFAIIAMPILSIIGVLLNISVLITLIKRKYNLRQNQNQQLSKTELIFDYILLKTIVNLMISILNCFNFTIKCVSFTSFYCSPFIDYFSGTLQYLDIILFSFIGSSLKLICSLISLMFSFTRFLIIFNKAGSLSRFVFRIKTVNRFFWTMKLKEAARLMKSV